MENAPYLYDTLVQVLHQHPKVDRPFAISRPCAWMMVGLIHSGSISQVHGRRL